MRGRILAAFAAGAIVAGLVVGGVAVAQSGGGTQYTGCIGIYGLLFQVAEGTEPLSDCGTATEVTWNQEGPEGPPGPQGPPGPSANGRVIPLGMLDLDAGGSTDFYPAVDTSDCSDLIASFVLTGNVAGVPDVYFAHAIPGVANVSPGFGSAATQLLVTVPNDANEWTYVVRRDIQNPNAGYYPTWQPGPETVVIMAGNGTGQATGYLYCIPRT